VSDGSEQEKEISVLEQVFQAFQNAPAGMDSLRSAVDELNDAGSLAVKSTLKTRLVIMCIHNSSIRSRIMQGNEFSTLQTLMDNVYSRYSNIINAEAQAPIKAILMQQFQRAKEVSSV